MLTILLGILGVFGVAFLFQWFQQVRHDARPVQMPTATQLGIGAFTNFWDTLGVGSYAPTTSLFKLFKIVPDEEIPGTLNVVSYLLSRNKIAASHTALTATTTAIVLVPPGQKH